MLISMHRVLKYMKKGRSLRVAFFVLFGLSQGMSVVAQRVVSLSPSVTQLIMQIGREDVIVGRTSYCPHINAVEVGDVLNIRLETVVALRPDIVIVVGFVKPAIVEKLKSLGIKVVMFDTPRSFDEICSQAEEIGKAIGADKEMNDMVAKEKSKVKMIKDRVERNGVPVFFQIGVRPLFSVVPNTYTDEFVKILGCRNVSDKSMPSREYVIGKKPTYIIMTSMGGLCEEESEVWQKLTNAKIVVVDDEKMSCPTPRNFREMLEEVEGKMSGL